MKQLLSLMVILTLALPLLALEVVIDEEGVGNWCQATPDEVWFVVMNGNQGKIFDADYQLMTTFTTGQQPYYIYGCGRDFDGDENIEVMYSIYSTTQYTQSIFVKDIATGAIDLELSDPGDYSWYASTGYTGGERFVQANRMPYGTSQYDRSVVYSSGVVHSVSDNPQPVPRPAHTWPNPFMPGRQEGVNLSFSLQTSAATNVSVYNARGQKVRTLQCGATLSPGQHTLMWDGRDDNARPVSSGMYLFRVESGGEVVTQRSIVLR